MRRLEIAIFAAAVLLTLTTAVLGSSYSDVVLADKPEAYWRLGDAAGTVAADSSGNAHEGTYSGVTLGQAGCLYGDSNAAAFFNSGSSIQAGGTGLVPNTDSWTVEAWVRVPATGTLMEIVSWYPGGYLWGHNSDYILGITAQGLPFYNVRDTYNNGVVVTGPNPVTDSAWHHVVGVLARQAGTMSLYVDEKVVASSPANLIGLVADSGIPVNLGHQPRYWTAASQFAGLMDEVAIYRSALSADRVRVHNEVGRGLTSDSDGDGVPDSLDKCPNTPPGSTVDSSGCIASCPVQTSQTVIDAAIQVALTSANATISQNSATISALNNDLNLCLASVATRDDMIALLQSQISALNATIASQSAQITTLNGTLATLNASIAEKDATIAALSAMIAELKASLSEKDAAIASLNTSIATLTATITDKDAMINALSASVASLNATVASKDAQIATLNASITNLNAALSDNDALIATLNATIAKLGASLADKDALIAALNATIAKVKAQLFGSDQTLAQLQQQVYSLTATVAMLNSQLAEKAQAINQLQQQMAGLNETIVTLNASLAAKDQAVAALNVQMAAKDQAVAALKAQIAANEQAIAALNAQIAGMFTKQQLDQAVQAGQQALIRKLNANLAQIFGTPGFVLQGATPADQVNSLTTAIANMPPGQIKKLQGLLGP